MEKREMFFKDKKKRRERQVKEKKKLLDGSDSEGIETVRMEGKRPSRELKIPSPFLVPHHALPSLK